MSLFCFARLFRVSGIHFFLLFSAGAEQVIPGQEQKAGELLAQVTQKEAGHQGALEAEHLRGLRAALGL